jgi:hypothetical protein
MKSLIWMNLFWLGGDYCIGSPVRSLDELAENLLILTTTQAQCGPFPYVTLGEDNERILNLTLISRVTSVTADFTV